MEKEWISAFCDNELGQEELSSFREGLEQEETGNCLLFYKEIGKLLRLQNPVPEVSESFRKRLRLRLQAEYDRIEWADDTEEKVTDRSGSTQNKVEAL